MLFAFQSARLDHILHRPNLAREECSIPTFIASLARAVHCMTKVCLEHLFRKPNKNKDLLPDRGNQTRADSGDLLSSILTWRQHQVVRAVSAAHAQACASVRRDVFRLQIVGDRDRWNSGLRLFLARASSWTAKTFF